MDVSFVPSNDSLAPRATADDDVTPVQDVVGRGHYFSVGTCVKKSRFLTLCEKAAHFTGNELLEPTEAHLAQPSLLKTNSSFSRLSGF